MIYVDRAEQDFGLLLQCYPIDGATIIAWRPCNHTCAARAPARANWRDLFMVPQHANYLVKLIIRRNGSTSELLATRT